MNTDVIFNEAWRVYRRRLDTFLSVIGLGILWGAIVVALIIITFFLVPEKTIALPIVIILGILLGIIGFWGQIALLFSVLDEAETLGAMDAYRESFPKLLSYFWVAILSGLITFGGFLLFVVPGIIFAVWFSFAFYVMRTEGVKGMNALMKSKEYVQGKWWDVFANMALLWVLSIVFSGILNLLAYMTGIRGIEGILSLIFNVFFTPFAFVFMFTLFKQLKKIKDDSVPEPTLGDKVPFILAGVLGMLVIPLIIAGVIAISVLTHFFESGDLQGEIIISEENNL